MIGSGVGPKEGKISPTSAISKLGEFDERLSLVLLSQIPHLLVAFLIFYFTLWFGWM